MVDTKITVRELRERHYRATQKGRNGIITKVLAIIKDEVNKAETERASRGGFGVGLANNPYICNMKKRIESLRRGV